MTVYADILFLVNTSLNWFSILLTAKIMKLGTHPVRMLLASAAGALAGIITLFVKSTFTVAIIEIASAFLMSAIAFGADKLLYYIKICTCLFASGITIGGSLTLLYSLFNRTGIELQKQNDMSTAFFLLLSFAVTVVAILFEKFIVSDKKQTSGIIKIDYENNSVFLDFLCDSGNFLRDPISGKPAIIIPKKELSGIVPSEILDFEPGNNAGLSQGKLYRIRLLPASTVCGNGIMTGFIPDKITVQTKKINKVVDAVIAIDKTDNNYSSFKAILPISLV